MKKNTFSDLTENAGKGIVTQLNRINKGLLLAIVLVLLFMGLPLSAQAKVYIGDHFDSQADYDGCIDPPAPWSSYSWSNEAECNRIGINGDSGDAHGSTGKSFQINWPGKIIELGAQYRTSPAVGSFWTGFWWRHNADYVMVEQDKFIYFPEVGGNRTMLSHYGNSLCFFDGSSYSLCADSGANPYPDYSSSAYENDTSWHYYVIFVSAADKDLRVWRDGNELTWDNDNLNVNGWNSSTFDADFWYWGYQSRVGWTNNISWFDDIILASTEAEVIDFLGLSGAAVPAPDPTPTNSQPVAIAGSDLTLTDTDGSGFEQIQLDGSGSSDPDGTIVSHQWREGSVILSNSPIATLNLAVGTHTITLIVTDNNGAQTTDNLIASITAGDTGDGGSSPSAEVLLQESFDNASTATRGWYDAGSTSPLIVTDAQKGKVLEYAYASGASTPTTGALRHQFTESDEVTLSYNVKYQSGWSWIAGDSGPHEFYLMTNLDHAFKGPAESHGTTYIEMHQGWQRLGFQDALNIDQTNIGSNLANLSENRGVFGCNGTSDTYADGICWGNTGAKINGKLWDVDMLPVQNNRWYQVKVHFKMNSIVNGVGVADGVMEYWLDGQLKMSLHDVMIRTGANANLKWNQIMIAPYFHNGTPKAQKFWIDDLLINSTSATAPSAPTGLRIL